MKRNTLIDIGKFFMAVCVIAMHTFSVDTIEGGVLYHTVVNTAVPFFFMTSGYLTNTKEYDSQVFTRRIYKLIRLYVVWSAIYVPAAIYGNYINGDGIVKSVLLYIRGFFFVGEHYMSWPLWYLLSLIYALLMIRFLKRKQVDDKYIWIISAIVFFIAYIMTKLVSYSEYSEKSIQLVAKIVKYTFGGGRLFTGLFLYCVGWFFAINKRNSSTLFTCNKKTSNLVALTGLCVSFVVSLVKYNIITGVIFIPALLLYLCIINENVLILQTSIGYISMVMYFTHMLVYWIVFVFFSNGRPQYGLIPFTVVVTVDCMLSIIISRYKNSKTIRMLF